jgi:hypothetical protein
MKKLLILTPLAIALAGCSNSDGKFADHAPGADNRVAVTSYIAQKPVIPMPKPDVRPPKLLK